jgi:hypothetical protein
MGTSPLISPALCRNPAPPEIGPSKAPKGRQIHSLGREPQENERSIPSSPERATDLLVCLSPLRGLSFFFDLILGLTPQAKYMSPLRGSPS